MGIDELLLSLLECDFTIFECCLSRESFEFSLLVCDLTIFECCLYLVLCCGCGCCCCDFDSTDVVVDWGVASIEFDTGLSLVKLPVDKFGFELEVALFPLPPLLLDDCVPNCCFDAPDVDGVVVVDADANLSLPVFR